MRYLLFLVCLCAGLMASAQEPFIIEGRVSGVTDSTMLVLHENETQFLDPVDTAYVVGGEFRFRHPMEAPMRMAILCFSPEFPPLLLRVWGEPGVTAAITGENTLLYTWTVDSPVAEQAERQRYIQPVKAHWDEIQRQWILISRHYQTLSRDKDMPAEATRAVNEQIAALESRCDSILCVIYRELMPQFMQAEPTDQYIEQLTNLSHAIVQKPAYGELRDDALKLYECLPPEQKASAIGKLIWTNLTVEERVLTGHPMADAELPDTSGALHKLSDYNGKYILLDFWASWCGPCVASIPELKEVAALYEDRLIIVGLNVDEKRENWLEATEKHEIPWVNLYTGGRSSEISVKYDVNGIPHQVLISPEGIVIGSWVGYVKGNIKKQLEEYLPEAE